MEKLLKFSGDFAVVLTYTSWRNKFKLVNFFSELEVGMLTVSVTRSGETYFDAGILLSDIQNHHSGRKDGTLRATDSLIS